tara:strand:+ start:36 stop:497 length:462 start_codon:yes stop_codon:yes gene_type:complete
MGICCSREKYLNLDKPFSIKIKTNIYNKYSNNDIKKIVDYVRYILQNEGSAFRKYISHYIYIKNIYLTTDIHLVFHIELTIDKHGKHNDKHVHYCIGKVLTSSELKKLFTVLEVKNHVYRSLDTAALCEERLLLSNDSYFSIEYTDIVTIEVL